MPPTYRAFSYQGDKLERDGKNYEAATEFKKAASVATSDRDKCAALHRAAINLRVACQYEDAEYTFHSALELTSRRGEDLRIARDIIMMHVEMGRISEDDEYALDEIYNRQLEFGQTIEAGVTLGFIARLDFALNKSLDAVLLDFMEADIRLRTSEPRNLVYELNNLIQWMKHETFINRFKLGMRGVYLAIKTGYRMRVVEAVILMTGGPKFYDRMKQYA